MQKRILLTGSNGLLGQKITNLLIGRLNTQLLATSRGANRHPVLEGYEYQDVDLCDSDTWDQIFEDFVPTDIIHSGAITQVDLCEQDHELCDKVNVEAVKRLSELCKKHNTRMTYLSTDFIFDGEAGPYKETDTPNPVNYYGASKLKAEQLIQANHPDSTILRTILLYGLTPHMSRSNIVLWAKNSLQQDKTINVVTDQFRCPTLAEDLAAATISAVMRKAEGIFHISGPEMFSIIDIAREVARFWNCDENLINPIDSSTLSQPARRPPKTGFVILKAQTQLDYKPHSLKQGLALVDRQLKEQGKAEPI